jgi:hypothetical protein
MAAHAGAVDQHHLRDVPSEVREHGALRREGDALRTGAEHEQAPASTGV